MAGEHHGARTEDPGTHRVATGRRCVPLRCEPTQLCTGSQHTNRCALAQGCAGSGVCWHETVSCRSQPEAGARHLRHKEQGDDLKQLVGDRNRSSCG